MKYCNNCGQMMADEAAVCPGCGAAQPVYAQSAQAQGSSAQAQGDPAQAQGDPAQAQGGSAQAQGGAAQQPPVYSRGYEAQYNAAPGAYTAPHTETLTTGGYLFALVVFMIPFIGFVMQLVWSFGGSENLARQSLARAYLLRSVILGALALIVVLIALALFIVPVGTYYYHGGF